MGVSNPSPTSLPSFHFDADDTLRLLVTRSLSISQVMTDGTGTATLTRLGPELLTQRAAFDNAAWAKTTTTIVANDYAAPDGTMTADRLTQTAEFGRASQTVTLDPQNKRYVFRTWLRASTPHNAQLTILNNDGTESVNTPVALTAAWTRFETSKTFTLSKTGIIARLFPTPSGITFDAIHAFDASLRQEETLTAPFSLVAGDVLHVTASAVTGDFLVALA
jgi:hypothetical protein